MSASPTRLSGLLCTEWRLYRRRRIDCVITISLEVGGQAALALLAVLILLMFLLPSRAWIVLFAGLSLTVLSGTLWAWQIASAVRFERRLLHVWVQVGDRLEEVFTLANGSLLPMLVAEIEDRSTLPSYDASTVRMVGGHDTHTWRVACISQQRGLFKLGPTTIRCGDPLGLFAVVLDYSQIRDILVYPPVLHALPVSAPRGEGQGSVPVRQRCLEETVAVGGIRAYAPGDPIRRIHWPLTARHRTFMVKEFNRDNGGDMWLVLDLDPAAHVGQGMVSTLEYAIIWAASWSWHLLRRGHGVGLFAYGPERLLIRPAKGTGHLWRILQALAPAQASAPVPLAALLGEIEPLVRHGHSLAVITPSTDPAWLERLLQPGLRPAAKQVILLDAASFHDSLEPARAAAIQATLDAHRIPVHLVGYQPGLLAAPATPGTGDWAFKATVFGRVIVRSRPAGVRP